MTRLPKALARLKERLQMCDCDDPFFLNALPSMKWHPVQEHSTAEYVIAFIGILFTCIIMWIMGYVSGLSNGESRAYKEMLQYNLVKPIEEVQNETLVDH